MFVGVGTIELFLWASAGTEVKAKYEGVMARLKSRLELSLYGKRFFQRMQVALRSGWACLFAGCVVQFGSPMNHWLAIPFFSLVICLNIIDSSIGAVLRTSVSVVVGMLEAMTAGTLLYLILGTDMSLVLTIFCVFVCSFCVAYPTRLVGQEMARKVSLALIGIIFTGAYNGMNDGSLLFLVRLMCTTMFGVFCALLAVCIPVPGLAFWEVLSSFSPLTYCTASTFSANLSPSILLLGVSSSDSSNFRI